MHTVASFKFSIWDDSYLSVSFGNLKNDNPGVFLLEFRHAIAEQNRPCECLLAMLLAGAYAPAAWSAAVAPCYTARARVSRLFVIGSLMTPRLLSCFAIPSTAYAT